MEQKLFQGPRVKRMILNYKLKIDESWNHCVKVTINGTKSDLDQKLELLMPAWSPGSYLMREYAKHLRRFRATTSNGEFLYFEKTSKSTWVVDWDKSELKSSSNEFCIEYEVYCNEVSVRTSHVDLEHAFIHGPSVFLMVKGQDQIPHQLEVEFPVNWTKLNTSLKDISEKRQHFIYEAQSFDELIDCPIEIGTQTTTGFMVEGVGHHIVNFREPSNFPPSFQEDCQKIVQTICDFWGEVPFDTYTFISHFLPSTYGGLEHASSTALQFDCFDVATKKGYLDFLGLVSHEYFHSWNVKRIRPVELGPFDYQRENYTRMHWLTEGLTSFVDSLFVHEAGLLSLESYLEGLTKKFNAYEATPGRYLDSLEESSFDAWIKLYRPHGNSHNSSVSYYLKGSLVFFCLNSLLQIQGRSIKEFCGELWLLHKKRPDQGVSKDEVLTVLEDLAGVKVRDEFESYLSTTIDLPLEQSCTRIGLTLEREAHVELNWGFTWEEEGGNVFVSKVMTDSPASQAGLNNGDEIIATRGVRINSKNYKKWMETVAAGKLVELLISRKGRLINFEVMPGKPKLRVKSLKVRDKALVSQAFKLS